MRRSIAQDGYGLDKGGGETVEAPSVSPTLTPKSG